MRRLLATFAALALLLPALPLRAAEVAVADATVDAAGLQLLATASEAWRTGNFRGRFIYTRGDRMDSMQVVHAWLDGVEYERLSHLDDSRAEVIRRGDELFCIHPDARVTRFDAAQAGGPFRALAKIDAGIGAHYQVSAVTPSRVSGHSALQLTVTPRDAHRYGYRLWLDQASKLPLRQEILNRKGRAMEAVEFVDLDSKVSVPRDMFDLPAAAVGGARTLRITRSGASAMAEVAPSWLPAGFRETGSASEHLGNAEQPVVASTWSDGLSAFTFFVERADQRSTPLMGRQVGPTVAISGLLDAGSHGRYLVTLVGEIPASTAMRIVESSRYTPSPSKVAPPAP